MKKNDTFTFTTSNGTKVKGVVLDKIGIDEANFYNEYTNYNHYLCYAQNKIFYYSEEYKVPTLENPNPTKTGHVGKTVVDFCYIPSFDRLLK